MRSAHFKHTGYYTAVLLTAVFGLFVPGSARAADITFPLFNHPDANADPPPYGLRLDDLFLHAPTAGSVSSPVGGPTTFSFDPADGASMTLTASMVGPDIHLNIAGTAYGGVDAGVTYGYGEGFYDIDFTYTMNVTEVAGPDGGYTVSPNSSMNTGTITAQAGITNVTAGTFWTFYDQTDSLNNSFHFLADGHRLGSYPSILADDPYVGRGWVTFNSNGTNTSGTQDWLFITPEPSSLALICIGGFGLLSRRPRRRRA